MSTSALASRRTPGESPGDSIMKVDHAGEHGAICIYRAQRWFARFRAPDMVAEIDGFLRHERQHRSLFAAELARRGQRRCRGFHLCGVGGLVLGAITGLAGRHAIAATTVAIESVVLRHMREQMAMLTGDDTAATETLAAVIADEEQHHDESLRRTNPSGFWFRAVRPVVSASTECVIWLGMRS